MDICVKCYTDHQGIFVSNLASLPMQSIRIADIELEKNVLSRVLHYVFGANLGEISEEDASNLCLVLDILHVENGSFFSISVYNDIFKYIHKCFCEDRYPSPWDLTRYLQGLSKYRSQQANITNQIKGLIEHIESSLYSLDSISIIDLANQLVLNTRMREINSKLEKGIHSPDEINDIRELLSFIEEPTSSRKKLEQKIEQYREAKNPIDKIESKRAMRMMGFSPQEILDVTDNFVPPRPLPKITPALDFLNEKFSDATWIYPGLIKAGVVNLITGQGGSGKTLFCYECLLSFLSSSDFLGETPSKLVTNSANRGLIINADQPAVDAQEMLKSNPKAWKLARDGKYDIVSSDWCLADILQLEMLLRDKIYNFVVIDSYKAIHSHIFGWDENHPSASTGIRELQRLCSLYGCTMLLIHHAGNTQEKGRHKSRGHSSIPDAASSVLSISASVIDDQKGDPNIRFLEISKTRNSERTKLTLKFNPLTYSYEILPDTNGIERSRINTLANNLMIEFKKEFPDALSTDTLLSKVSGGDRKTLLSKALQKLEQRGWVEKIVDEISNEFYYKLVANSNVIPLKTALQALEAGLKEDFNDF